jgi:hypothetical protein
MPSERDNPLPPGKALWDLTTANPARVGAALDALMARAREGSLAELDVSEALARTLDNEWEALGRAGPGLVPALSAIFQDPRAGLLHVEIVGLALAQQGEDGMGELIGLLDSEDFVLRHKAVVGLGTLGRRGRVAVPALARLLETESQPLIVWNAVDALGQIGGPEAVKVLSGVRRWLAADAADAVSASLDRALALAQAAET